MNDDVIFASWQAHYRDHNGIHSTLGLAIRDREIVLLTATGDRLHFTPLETGLLLDGLAAALRAVGSVP
jgi:hypothetical protein